MKLVAFCVSRVIQLVPVLLGITVIAFLLLRALPGDPATLMLGSRGTAADIANLTAQLGLDRPLWQQYLSFLADILRGSFGQSIAYRSAVAPLVLARLGPTLALVGVSTLMALALTVPLAMLTALKRGGLFDHGVKLVFVVALSMPPFWLGILLVLLLSIHWPLFPVSGYGEGWVSHLWHLVLPSAVIALGTAALTIKSLRSSVIAVLGADFVDTARAKGLRNASVLWKHVFRNSLMSTISVLAVHTSWVIGGTVVIETVFGIPGLGSLLVSSIGTRDYPMVQGLTVVFAVLVVIINLLADVAYSLIDPRVSLS
ncbi:ABC transporter permease [Paraburkholderia unamae]|uniref:Peptide/nickel transport system permease protein n=1 Tax=Paraburkholderia unamae TaxID=219649 RepID=A0ABX5KMZ4_9BURK|nr:ABC transporter permease [Paraburkholderia unamae]PVX81357.1 peptide/nickel transport system permease protein [Paraburkholderia unamae]RAR57193.1 peptide/nickel transport system permease protein [Paraburkholderia unamae]CAG9243354.1 Peptide/nickel transport system permease protein [Paraburkholderia unamae]